MRHEAWSAETSGAIASLNETCFHRLIQQGFFYVTWNLVQRGLHYVILIILNRFNIYNLKVYKMPFY